MKAYRVQYRDWAYGEWVAASMAQVDVWARSESEAVQQAEAKFGSLGKSYRVAIAD